MVSPQENEESFSDKGRRIWTKEEDKLLFEQVKLNQKIEWECVAKVLKEKISSTKSSKQCRERFRNYLDPSLQNKEWKPQEKLLFLHLHNLFGNQWCRISGYFNQRGDVPIKNYFYSIVRKAIRLYKTKEIPSSFLKKTEKVFQQYLVLDLIKKKYIPTVYGKDKVPKAERKEKVLVNLIKEHNVTEKSIEQYQELLIQNFKKENDGKTLPEVLTLNLCEIGMKEKSEEELASYGDYENLPQLKEIITMKINFGKKIAPQTQQQIVTHSFPLMGRPALFLPVNQFIYPWPMAMAMPIMNPYNSTNSYMVNQFASLPFEPEMKKKKES